LARRINYTYLNQKQFAELAGVTQGAISRQISVGNIVWALTEDGKKDGINPDDPKNKSYLERAQSTNSGNKLDVQAAKAAFAGGQAAPKVNEAYQNAAAESRSQDAEIKKIDRALKFVKLAEAQNKLVPKEAVELFWNKVVGGLYTYIYTIAPRFASEIVSLFSIDITKVEDVVNERMMPEILKLREKTEPEDEERVKKKLTFMIMELFEDNNVQVETKSREKLEIEIVSGLEMVQREARSVGDLLLEVKN